MTGKAWLRFLVVGTAGVVLGAIVGGPARPLLGQLVGWSAIVAMVTGLRGWEVDQRIPWYGCALSGAMFLIAPTLTAAQAPAAGTESVFPSLGDAVAYVGYLVLIAALVKIIRMRGGADESSYLLDALIVGAGVCVAAWAVVLGPYVRMEDVSTFERLVNVAFSILTIALVVVTARVAVGPGHRALSYYLVATAIFFLFITDVLATLNSTGSPTGDLFEILSPIPYVLIGSAALHPSMPMLTKSSEGDDVPLTLRRVVLLGVALLMAPAVLVWQFNTDERVDVPVVVTGTIVLSLLVLARLTTLVRTRERTASRERVLRQAGEALVAATTAAEMQAGALDAVVKLGARTPGLRATLAVVDDSEVRVVAARGHRADGATGHTAERYDLPMLIRDGLIRRQPVSKDDVEPIDLPAELAADTTASVRMVPLVTQAKLRGALVVTTDVPLPREVARSVDLLAAEVSLGVESLSLAVVLQRQRSEGRFRVLVVRSNDIVLVVDEQGQTTFVSSAVERLLGVPEASVLGRPPPLEMAHPDDRAIAEALITGNGLATQATSSSPGERPGLVEPSPTELRLQHVDGDYRWFEVQRRDLRHEPEIAGFVITAREITHRKGAEERLARSEARFRALVQRSADLVAVVDIEGRFTYVSPSVTEMLGHRPEELLGRLSGNLMATEDVHVAWDLLEQFREERPTTANIEVQARTAAGAWRNLDITLTDLRHEPAVEGVAPNCRDVTERRALEHDLRYQALHDALTGLPNRVMFTARVTEALERKVPVAPTVATLFIGLADFKTVNDSLGHAAGDSLLLATAERLHRCLRPGDVAARLGGDEFAVCIETTSGDHAPDHVASRLLEALRQPFDVADRKVVIGASIGIAIGTGGSGIDAETLLRNADLAMYLAKDRGKDRYEVFEEQMHTTAFERLELKNDLARDIEEGRLRLHYQPVVSLQTGRITGVEALVRWDHPERGLLGPDSFVGMAEETGLIVPLGEWVLEEACQQLRAWQLGLPTGAALSMSVNLSVRQLQHDGIVETVAAALGRFGLDPSTLTLELTESMLMEDVDVSQERLDALRALGTPIAIDDFGTGYSSLGYIQRFPVDLIKIDRSFVSDLGPHPSQRFVMQSMVELAQRLGVHIVAEGIERRDQLLALQALGCDLGQGYHFSRPVPAEAMADLLAEDLSEGSRSLYR